MWGGLGGEGGEGAGLLGEDVGGGYVGEGGFGEEGWGFARGGLGAGAAEVGEAGDVVGHLVMSLRPVLRGGENGRLLRKREAGSSLRSE